MGNFWVSFLALGMILIQTSSAVLFTVHKRVNNADCKTYLIQGGDTCPSIAKAHSISTANIEKYNSQTWGWYGCDKLRQGDFICVTAGKPPMPAALPGAVCGPRVPGTVRPNNGPIELTKLATLNPCPAGECCTAEGKCKAGANSCGAAAGPAVAGRSTTTTTTKTIKKTTTTSTTSSTTTKQKTTTTASADSKDNDVLWSIAVYNQKGCLGDYYLIEGRDPHTNDKCVGIHSGLDSTDNGKNTWCRYYTDGGFNSTDCASGPELEVESWWITSGICTVYDTETCEPNGMSQAYAQWINMGCNPRDKWSPKIIGGLKCSHEQ